MVIFYGDESYSRKQNMAFNKIPVPSPQSTTVKLHKNYETTT